MGRKSALQRPALPSQAPKQLEELAQPSGAVEEQGPEEQAQPLGENPNPVAQNPAKAVTEEVRLVSVWNHTV